eukprot:m51a1_g8304 putative histidine kinase (641) ;mRNA; f:57192-59512
MAEACEAGGGKARIIRDQDDRIVFWDSAASFLYGYTSSEAIGTVTTELLRTVFPAPVEEIKKELCETGRWEGVLVHLHRDGTPIAVYSKWSCDHECRNIFEVDTRRGKRPPQVLTRIRAYENIFPKVAGADSFGEVVIMLNHKHVITFWNRKAELYYGWRQLEVLGKNVDVVLHSVFPVSRDAALNELGETGEWNGVLQQTTKDGRVVHVLSNWIAQSIGDISFVLEINTDVTMLKREMRYKALFQQHADRAKNLEMIGTVAFNLAHEWNNVLTAISGMASLANEQKSPDVMGRSLEEIERISTNAATLGRSLLSYGRTRRSSPARSRVDLCAFLANIRGILRCIMGRGCEVSVLCEPGPALCCIVDSGELERAFLNLVLNSRDARATRVDIRAGPFTATPQFVAEHPDCVVTPGMQCVRCDVADNGAGIPEHYLAHVFDPLFTTKTAGTGLGLCMVKTVVEAFAGVVDVASKPGQGATFSIVLPVAPGSAASEHEARSPHAVAAPAAHEPAKRSGRVLLVEDDPLVRKVSTALVQRLGYTVAAASSGAEALALVAGDDQGFDVLFTDMYLQDYKGTELVQAVLEEDRRRPRRRSGAMAVMMCSGAPVSGVRDLLPKPFNLDTLSRVLDNAVAHAREPEE